MASKATTVQEYLDELPEDRAEFACALLQDLRDASDENGEALDPKALASLDRGLKDIAQGHVKPLEEYRRERGL